VRAPHLAAALGALALVAGGAVAGVAGSEASDAQRLQARAAAPTVDRFDERRAWSRLRWQVRLGERPAGSATSRRLARAGARLLPRGRIEREANGVWNVVGSIPGRKPAILVGAHYDTKDLPGFVGANDGASGVAVVLELARVLARAPRRPGAREVRFVLFDAEESPGESRDFLADGLRGSRAYVARHRGEIAQAIVVDMVGDRDLAIPRETSSDPALWSRLRGAAVRVGAGSAFPPQTRPPILDDHIPFQRAGITAVDIIDFTYQPWHTRRDTLDKVSRTSLDLVGETLVEYLRPRRRARAPSRGRSG